MAPSAEVRFTRIYETHYAKVLAYCARRMDRAAAEDVASEVFVTLWRRMDGNGFDEAEPLPWLYGVAYRAIANRRRGARRKVRLSERLRGIRPDYTEDTDMVVVRREHDRAVLAAIDRLSEQDQQVIRLAAWEELSARHIAEVVGCSLPAAEQRLHRAKKRLAKVLSNSSFESIVSTPLPAEEGGQT